MHYSHTYVIFVWRCRLNYYYMLGFLEFLLIVGVIVYFAGPYIKRMLGLIEPLQPPIQKREQQKRQVIDIDESQYEITDKD